MSTIPRPARASAPGGIVTAQLPLVTDDVDFFTAGYEGRSSTQLVEAMIGSGARLLLDIRADPDSGRASFTSRSLERTMRRAGLAYLHMPELGVPRAVRTQARMTGSQGSIWAWYAEHVLPRYVTGDLTWFRELPAHPAVMLCVERNPRQCHRGVLAAALERRGLQHREI